MAILPSNHRGGEIEFSCASGEEKEGQENCEREDPLYDPLKLIEQDERCQDLDKEHSAWVRETSKSGHAGLAPNNTRRL